MWARQAEPGRLWIGRLDFRSDLLSSIEEFAAREKIEAGRVEAIGAVEKAVVGYYHQQKREYLSIEINENLEILSCLGNLSLRDGQPAAHLHILLGDRRGSAKGGHLQRGTLVFAGEFVIQELKGPELVRGFDGETGLPLWEKGGK